MGTIEYRDSTILGQYMIDEDVVSEEMSGLAGANVAGQLN